MPAAAPSSKDMIDITPRPRKGGGLLRAAGLVFGGLALAGAGFGGGWFYFSTMQSPVSEALRLIEREAPGAEAPPEEDPAEPQKVPRVPPETDAFVTTYYNFEEPLTTNLSGSRRFLQIGISVSTQYDATVMTHVETHKAALQSDMLAVAGGFTEEQISGREGREGLATALRDAINERLVTLEGFGGVEGVFFTSFVLQ